MISHKHRCIFIHIAKCAGTSVENAFGYYINTPGALEAGLGWDKNHKLYRQHATPQQLLDFGLVKKEHWDSYYKFIIYRNSWSKLLSDFFWVSQANKTNDSFENFLYKAGNYKRILNDRSQSDFCGDHLYLQKEYFFLDGKPIKYDASINFDELNTGLDKVISDLKLNPKFFNIKNNVSLYKHKHYSFFYDLRSKNLVQELYGEDIDYFRFKFKNKTPLPLFFNSILRKTI